jgi:dienelactone hydrolase
MRPSNILVSAPTKALLDLEAALQWAKSSGHTGPILVWGSSYSAAPVFLLAAEHRDEIKAIVAFSPGEYLRGATTVRKEAAQVSIPIFVTSAKDPEEIAVAKSILDAAHSPDKTQFVPQFAGVHGSSTSEKTRTQTQPKKIGRRSNNFSRNSPPSCT